jgi:hypothetical protein
MSPCHSTLPSWLGAECVSSAKPQAREPLGDVARERPVPARVGRPARLGDAPLEEALAERVGLVRERKVGSVRVLQVGLDRVERGDLVGEGRVELRLRLRPLGVRRVARRLHPRRGRVARSLADADLAADGESREGERRETGSEQTSGEGASGHDHPPGGGGEGCSYATSGPTSLPGAPVKTFGASAKSFAPAPMTRGGSKSDSARGLHTRRGFSPPVKAETQEEAMVEACRSVSLRTSAEVATRPRLGRRALEKTRKGPLLVLGCLILSMCLTAFPRLVSAESRALPVDPLPSWNEGPARRAIIDFVSRVTEPGGRDFLPVAERIAVFDNDGTLSPEDRYRFNWRSPSTA